MVVSEMRRECELVFYFWLCSQKEQSNDDDVVINKEQMVCEKTFRFNDQIIS